MKSFVLSNWSEAEVFGKWTHRHCKSGCAVILKQPVPLDVLSLRDLFGALAE